MATIRNDRDKLLQSATVRVIRTVLMTLSKYLVVLAADSEGIEEDITKANISVSVLVDGTEDVANWSLSITTTGCAAHVSGDDIIFDGFDVLNTTDSCSITVTATKATFTNQVATLEIVRARSGSTSTELSLSPSALSLPADYLGRVSSYSGMTSVAKLVRGFTDVTADWTLTKEDSPGILSTILGDTVSIINSAGVEDAGCVASLDLDSLTFLDSSIRRRFWGAGVTNALTSTYCLTPTISSTGPSQGYQSTVFTTSGSSVTLVRSFKPGVGTSPTTDSEHFSDIPQTLTTDFSLSFFVSFDDVSSATVQYLYNTSSPSATSITSAGPIRIEKIAGSAAIGVRADNMTGYAGGALLLTTASTLVNNVFYNVALTYIASTRVLTLYLDGNFVQTVTLTNTNTTGLTQMCIALGGRPYNTTSTGLNGKMALFKLWNYVRFNGSFAKEREFLRLPTNYDLLSDKVVVGLDFTEGKMNESAGNVFALTNGATLQYHTDSDGTGAIITGGWVESGLLSSLKLTGPFCIEMKVKFLTGFDFAVFINSDTSILKFRDKDNNERFEMRVSNPGVLGASYTAASMRDGPSSASSIFLNGSNLTLENVVYHLCARLDNSSTGNTVNFSGTANGIDGSSAGATTWYHFPGIDSYKLRIGNDRVNKGSKMVIYWVKITSGSRRYEKDFVPPTVFEKLQTSGYVDVTATKATNTLTKRLSVSKQLAGAPSTNLTFTPNVLDLVSDANGWVTTLPSVSMDVLLGTSSDFGNWTSNVSSFSGIEGTISGSSVILTKLVSTNNVQLMLTGDSFTDVSEYRRPVTASFYGSAIAPTINTDWSPFGGSGRHYKFVNSNSDQQAIQLAPGSTTMHIGTSDYTLEMLFSTDSDPTAGTFMLPLWHRGSGTELFGSDLCVVYDSTNKWRVSSSYTYANPFDVGGTSTRMTFPSAPDVERYKTYHLAVVRSGTAIYLYLNGTRYTSSTSLAGGFNYYNTNQNLFIGYRASTTYTATMRIAQVRFTIGLARYTATTITVPTGPFQAETPDSGFLAVTSTRAGFPALTKQLTYTKVKSAAEPKQAVTTGLTSTTIQVLADVTGVTPSSSYTGANTVAKVFIGGIDDTANWTFSHTASSGITATMTGNNTFNVTALTDAFTTGTINITASRLGWSSVTIVCNVTKLRQLAPAGLAKGVLLGTAYDWSTSSASATVTFKTNGEVTLTYLGATATSNWYNPTTTSVGSSYHVTITGPTIGTSMSGVTLGTAYQLTSDRAITVNQNTTGDAYGRYTYTIRADSGGTPAAILASGFFDISIQVV